VLSIVPVIVLVRFSEVDINQPFLSDLSRWLLLIRLSRKGKARLLEGGGIQFFRPRDWVWIIT